MMKRTRFLAGLMAACIGVSAAMIPSVDVQAGTGVVYAWHNDGFDGELYAAMYPELAAVYGNNNDLLWNHFKTTGYYEGRIGKMKMPVTTKLTVLEDGKYFNAAQYALDNPDVAAVLGSDPATLWAHYLNNGYAEGRQVHATTNAKEAELILIDTVNSITNPGMSDTEKIKACHDWIVDKMDYDYAPGEITSLEACVFYGKGVCHQYTQVFEYMMDVLGIESQYLLGFGHDGTQAHGWNRVKVNGEWKYIDCTWDDTYLEGFNRAIRYRDEGYGFLIGTNGKVIDINTVNNGFNFPYFLISLEDMSQNHTLMTTDGYTSWVGWTREQQDAWFGLQRFDAQTMVGVDP